MMLSFAGFETRDAASPGMGRRATTRHVWCGVVTVNDCFVLVGYSVLPICVDTAASGQSSWGIAGFLIIGSLLSKQIGKMLVEGAEELFNDAFLFPGFEARDAASPLQRSVQRRGTSGWSYARTVSRTNSSMRLSSSALTSWLANSSESCWARSW